MSYIDKKRGQDMKLGDLVWIKDLYNRTQWGFGLIVEVYPSRYENHAPYVSVFWSSLNRTTMNHTTAYIEVINESR